MRGRRVLVTRPRAQCGPWVRRLQAAGHDALALPLIDIAPVADPSPLRRAWAALPGLGLVVFVSPSAVAHFFALAPEGEAWPVGPAAAAPGPGTLDGVRAQGVPEGQLLGPPPEASQFDAEALWSTLAPRAWRGVPVLIVRGADEGEDDPDGRGQGRPWLAEQLARAGAEVQTLAAYRRAPPAWSPDEAATAARALGAPGEHAWLFTSSQGIGFLPALLGGPLPAGPHAAVATHPRIAESARQAGFNPVEEAAPPLESLLAALQRLPPD